MVMTDWMRSVQAALKTIPKNTPNRLGEAMKKAKLTYVKKKKDSSSSSSDSSNVMMNKTFKRRRGRKGKGKGKGSRKHHSRRHRGGAMTTLNPAKYDGKGVGTSGAALQVDVTNNST
jgi:hypothetical protein